MQAYRGCSLCSTQWRPSSGLLAVNASSSANLPTRWATATDSLSKAVYVDEQVCTGWCRMGAYYTAKLTFSQFSQQNLGCVLSQCAYHIQIFTVLNSVLDSSGLQWFILGASNTARCFFRCPTNKVNTQKSLTDA